MIAWCLVNEPVRRALFRVVRAAFALKLSSIWLLGALWLIFGVKILHEIQLWAISDLKGTIIWGLFAGTVLIVRGFSNNGEYPDFRKTIRDLFGVMVVVELLVATYTFGILIEVLLVSISAFAVMVQAYSDTDVKYKPTKVISTVVLFVIGSSMFLQAILGLVESPEAFISVGVILAFGQSVLLTLWMIPISYFIGLIAAYEQLFIPINCNRNTTFGFGFFVKSRLFWYFGLSLRTVIDARRRLAGRLLWHTSVREIDQEIVALDRL